LGSQDTWASEPNKPERKPQKLQGGNWHDDQLGTGPHVFILLGFLILLGSTAPDPAHQLVYLRSYLGNPPLEGLDPMGKVAELIVRFSGLAAVIDPLL